MTFPAQSPKPLIKEVDVPLRPIALYDVIKDCGGPNTVAKRLGVSPTTVTDWSRRGRIPDSDLRLEGGTNYSDQLADMQREGTLSAAVIRRLGRRL